MRRDLPRLGEHRDDLGAAWASAIDECTHATACDGLKTCIEHNQCGFVLQSPTDREPEFMCRPPVP